MEREKIELTNSQWWDVVFEHYYEDDFGNQVEFKELDDIYDGSGRHTEYHHKILQRITDGKCFRIDYETSVKDSMGWNECNYSMGWDECNYGDTEMEEVFPKTIQTIIYE